MSDYYLQHPEALLGKPKATIADYVEEKGILVPRRFSSLDDALSSGVPIIARSEHPQDYDGASAVLYSVRLKNLEIDGEKSIMDEVFWEGAGSSFCQLTGTDYDEFKSQVSVSYWEFLDGFNVKIIADSAIEGRHHIMAIDGYPSGHAVYSIIDNDAITDIYSNSDVRINEAIPRLINLYERVRKLENFDPNHCPILEVQYFDGELYFLQYHRTRDFEPAGFVLDRQTKENEYEALLVRGATAPDGEIFKTTLINWNPVSGKMDWSLREDEEARFDLFDARMFHEVSSRNQSFNVTASSNKENAGRVLFNSDHFSISSRYKPRVSFILSTSDYNAIMGPDDLNAMYQIAKETGEDQFLNLKVISDGRRAFMERVD